MTDIHAVVIGALVAFILKMVYDCYVRYQERESVRAGFAGEMLALLNTAKLRNYEELLSDETSLSPIKFAPTTEVYFEFYHNNVSRIGILAADDTRRISEFYVLAKAFINDLNTIHSENSEIVNGGRGEARKKTLEIFRSAQTLAQEFLGLQ